MKKAEIIKTVKQMATIGVSAGVGIIIGNTIKLTTPTEGMNILKKACVSLGGIALGAMVSDAAVDYTDKQIDEACKMVEEVVSEDAKNSTDVEENPVEA